MKFRIFRHPRGGGHGLQPRRRQFRAAEFLNTRRRRASGRNRILAGAQCESGETIGAVIPLLPARSARRECGTCTACCDGWVVGTIHGHDMKPGVPCHFRGEGCCAIYESRPEEPCRSFACGWLLPGSPFPEDFRPDRLGVMIIPIRWRSRAAYILRSAGRDPDERLLGWMQDFSARTGAPFFYERAGERYGFGPEAFRQEMLQKHESGQKLW
jgi:hypothetical protein